MTVIIVISFLLASLAVITIPYVFHPQQLDARCPNGYHKSPSGDCEQVVPHEGKLPRCPDGFHRSPDGDCERVADNNSNDGDNNKNQLSDIPFENGKDTTSSGGNSLPSSHPGLDSLRHRRHQL